MRKNIFEILSEDFDIVKEIRAIWHLFIYANVTYAHSDIYNGRVESDILGCVDKFSFHDWKSRNRFLSPYEMMMNFDINERKIVDINCFCVELLDILEFFLNIIKRCDVAIENYHVIVSNDYYLLKGNINEFIEYFGYGVNYNEDSEQVIIFEKNQAAVAVAEISESDTAKKILQYNNYKLKGDIESKKNIILLLASQLEPQRNVLENINKSLVSDLFFMLNNMNLRHNNIESKDKNFKKIVGEMGNEELEE